MSGVFYYLYGGLNYHHKYAGKRAPEIGAIDVRALFLWDVDLLTSRAENLDSACTQFFTHPHWEHILPLTKDSWAGSEASSLVLLFHEGQASRSDYEACVNQTIKISRFLINLQETLILQVFIVRSLWGQYHFQGLALKWSQSILVIVEFRFQAVKVEVIADEVLVHLAQELMVLQSTKPLYPSSAIGILGVVFNHSHSIPVIEIDR